MRSARSRPALALAALLALGACRSEPEPTATSSEGLVGWASEAGGTSGGAAGRTFDVHDAAGLVAAAAAPGPAVIRIHGEVAVPALAVASDKTLVGVAGARLRGGIALEHVHNVIVSDLVIDARTSAVGDGDGIRVSDAHHVWLDHLDIHDAADGDLDISEGASFITVSWSKLWYSASAPRPEHRFASLVGADDAAVGDRGRLKVTFHHVWWGPGILERMPRVRFGEVHVFNCYYASPVARSCIRAAREARVLVEGNVFDGVASPHERHFDGGTSELVARDNLYLGTSGRRESAGDAFVPPYAYRLDDPTQVKRLVMAGAGPR